VRQSGTMFLYPLVECNKGIMFLCSIVDGVALRNHVILLVGGHWSGTIRGHVFGTTS
jgi:hypothetical protein